MSLLCTYQIVTFYAYQIVITKLSLPNCRYQFVITKNPPIGPGSNDEEYTVKEEENNYGLEIGECYSISTDEFKNVNVLREVGENTQVKEEEEVRVKEDDITVKQEVLEEDPSAGY